MGLPWTKEKEIKDTPEKKSPLKAFQDYLTTMSAVQGGIIKKGVGDVFKAGARYPRAALSAAEAHQKFKQVPAKEFYKNPEQHTKNWLDAIWGGAKKGFAPEIYAPDEEVRDPNEIAWDMADKVYSSKSKSVAWEYVKTLPFTTLGTMSSIRLNPAIFLAFKGVDAVLRNLPPKMKEFVFKQRKLWKTKPLKSAYKELGLKSNASLKEVEQAYRNNAMKYHPDRPSGKTVEGISKFVNGQAAYEKIKGATSITKVTQPTTPKPKVSPTPQTPATVTPIPNVPQAIVSPILGTPQVTSVPIQVSTPQTPAFTEKVVGSTRTKAIIHKATGFKNLVENVTARETDLLKNQIQTLSRGGKAGIQVGKEIQRKQGKVKSDIVATVKSILNLKKAKIPKEFKEIITEQLDDLGLGKGQRPLKAKSKLLDFIADQEAKGELIPISKEDLTTSALTNLGNATLDLLNNKLDILKQVVHLGRTQQFLIAGREQQDFQRVVDSMVKSVFSNSKKIPSEIRALPLTPSERAKTFTQNISDAVDSIFAHHQKAEFLAIRLDGFTRGVFHDKVIMPIQHGANKDLKLMEEDMDAFNKVIRTFSKKELNQFFSKQTTIAGRKMTPNEMVGVYVNSFAPGNIRRLKLDNKFTDEDIAITKQMVSRHPDWKKLADKMMEIAGNKFSQFSTIKEKITGKPVSKVEGYFPIAGDKELDPAARMKGKDIDLFQDAVQKMTPEAGFAETRTPSARGAIDLDSTKVFMNHIKKVNHYIGQALPVRDVRKILSNPAVQKSMIDVLGEHSFSQFPSWLQAVANPRAFSVTGDVFDKWAGYLKRNATSAILGLKVSVSLLQPGSYSQTVGTIGEKWAALGIAEYISHPIKAPTFMYKMSIQQRYRSQHLDRDIKEYMESTSVKNLIKGKVGSPALFFSMIRGMDKLAVVPTWTGAYHKGMSIYKGNQSKAVDYADSIVRTTQPAGAVKDLAAVSRGSNFKKLWTMFYTHFSNYQNNMANAYSRFKTGKANPFLKTARAARDHWYFLVLPALIAAFVRSGGKAKPKDYSKSVITYSFSGIIGLRDLVNTIAFGRPSPISSPGLAGGYALAQLALAVPKGDVKKLIKYGIKTTGFVTGLPTEQAWITTEGVMDLMARETDDIRRLFYSKYALGGDEDLGYGVGKSRTSSGGNLPW